MIKLAIGLFGYLAVAGTADTNAEFSMVGIAIGTLIASAFFLKGLHDVLGINMVSYDR